MLWLLHSCGKSAWQNGGRVCGRVRGGAASPTCMLMQAVHLLVLQDTTLLMLSSRGDVSY